MREQDRRGMWTPDCWCVHCLHCQLCLMCELSIYYVFVMWPDCQPITQRNAADCDSLCGLRHKLLIKYIKSLRCSHTFTKTQTYLYTHRNPPVPSTCMIQNQTMVNIFSGCFNWLLQGSSGWRWWNVLSPQLLMTCAGCAWFSSTLCSTICGFSLLKEKEALWTTIESLQVLLTQPLLGFVWVSRSGNSCPDLQTKRAIFNGIWSSFNWERW